MVSALVLVASLFALAAAKPAPRSLVVHDKRGEAPHGFAKVGAAADEHTFNLRVGLASNNIEGLEKELYAVSTPSSARYGQHLSKEEIKSFVAPTDEALSAVKEWLASHGLSAVSASPAGDWLSVPVSVAQANSLLNANYEVYNHVESGKDVVRTLEYSIPADLRAHIDTLHPTTSFNKPVTGRPIVSTPARVSNATDLARGGGGSKPSSCSSSITPACLQSLYGIPATPATQSSNKIAVAGFIDQYAQTADLKGFLKKYRTDVSSSNTFSLETLDGGVNTQSSSKAGIEANLDVQYTIGVATDVPTVFVSVGDSYQDGDLGGFLDIVNYLLDEDDIPQVMTTSYGENESDLSSSLSIKLCQAYMQLGAAGTSVLFASGDGGVSGGQSQSCKTFQPAFPAGCPYLTAVGATTGVSPETAADLSSGGFSNVWSAPSYQTAAVAGYLKVLGKTYNGLYNKTGRGFPDVAAYGENVAIISGGKAQSVAGTSCSSPIFASVVALLNDELLAAGKPPLGFLNPWLYANAGALNDITSGSNPGCNTNGFSAKAGWDPVTGLGSPNFAKLKAAAGL